MRLPLIVATIALVAPGLAPTGALAGPLGAANALKATPDRVVTLVQQKVTTTTKTVVRPAPRTVQRQAVPRRAVAVQSRTVTRTVTRPTNLNKPTTVTRTVIKPTLKPTTTTVTRTTNKPGLTTGQKIAIGAAVGAGGVALAAGAGRAGTVTLNSNKQPIYTSKLNSQFKSAKYVQTGLKITPAVSKPAFIVHNKYYYAGNRGYRLGYRPFWYTWGGYRWYRYYYAVPAAGGLYYWYWYNANEDYARTNFNASYVSDGVIECDPDDDDCGE